MELETEKENFKPRKSELTEAQIQAQIVKRLQSIGCFCHSVPNEAAGRDRIRMGQLVAMGLRAGVADLVAWIGDGRVAYLEVKTPKGRPSEVQQTFARRCVSDGYAYRIVRSADEAERAVRELMALPDEKGGKAE